MGNLRICRIDDKYVRFLHGSDYRVQHNKDARRPYVGVVLLVGSYRYFVPLESPKPSHRDLKPSVFILPIEKGRYGILGFNNMIPVPLSALISFDISAEPDPQYADLLRRQAAFFRSHEAEIMSRAAKTYFRATSKTADEYFRKACCDFRKLEAACDRYDPNYRPGR